MDGRTKKQVSRVLRKAAENVILNRHLFYGCCIAINDAVFQVTKSYKAHDMVLDLFIKYFAIDAVKYNRTLLFWMGPFTKENAKIRATALLLCAEVLENE